LTGYKMPRFVEFSADPLPKSSLGKVLRRQVREASGSAAKAGEPVA
jgi:long-chain acyl-CoA synthetase